MRCGNSLKDRLLIEKMLVEIVSWKFSTTSLLLLPLSLVPPIAYYVLREKDPLQGALWTVVLSVSFAFNALKQFKLDSFRTGTYLLAGLFFYDVWWVFGTEVVSKPTSARTTRSDTLSALHHSLADGLSCEGCRPSHQAALSPYGPRHIVKGLHDARSG